MATRIVYKMEGFNKRLYGKDLPQKYQLKLTENNSYLYPKSHFLDKVHISDFLQRMTFYLKAGEKLTKERIEEIEIEKDKICFNLIISSKVYTKNPLCYIVEIIEENGKKIKGVFHDDGLRISEEVIISYSLPAKTIYKKAFENLTKMKEKHPIYEELFQLLQSPHMVIQFMGLYDIMAKLIKKNATQRDVAKYFEDNSDIYDWNCMTPSRKNPNILEDSLTFLRNKIAHSKGLSVIEYRRASESVSESHIKKILTVINHLLERNN